MLDLEIREDILLVQQGKEEERNRIIKKYLPFILKVTSRTCKRFVRAGEDDEVSVALIAFNEALDKYNTEQNSSFFSFAETVIKRRIIDYFRKNQHVNRDLPLSSLASEGEEEEVADCLDKLTWQEAAERYFEREITEIRREEIKEYARQLKDYGIEFRDLVKVSPKHQDARISALQVARLIVSNEKNRLYLERTKTLPMKELVSVAAVSRKTLERQRKYIIALVVILTGEFFYLQDYLEQMKG